MNSLGIVLRALQAKLELPVSSLNSWVTILIVMKAPAIYIPHERLNVAQE